MSDERKQVICPWCGGEIHICLCDYEGNHRDAEYLDNSYSGVGYYLAHTQADVPVNEICPIAQHDDDGTQLGIRIFDTEQEAYDAAVRRPENRPLTREELFSLPQDDTVAVWSVLKASGFKRSWTVEEVLERYKLVEERGKMNIPAEVWFFKNYPTPHDINLA